MLYVGYGHPDDIYFHVDMEFDELYESSWLKNEMNLRIIKEVANCHLECDGLHNNDFEDWIFSIKEIPTGAKALMICNMCDDVKIWGSIFDDNCTKILQELARVKDICIYLQHILEFSDKEGFEAFSLTKNRKYESYGEYELECALEVVNFANNYYKKPEEKTRVEYTFECDFVDPNNTVLHVNCEGEDESYYMLIDTWDDPYLVYYSGKQPKDNEGFRKVLFNHLKGEFPEYF